MPTSLTDVLCTRCGLCCDGSLFADVELTGPAEAIRLEVMGLDVDDDDTEGGLLSLPCRALRGTRCGIYAHRPQCCRTFECALLQDAQDGTVAVERAAAIVADARGRIARVRTLMARLGRGDRRLPLAERYAEALAEGEGGDPAKDRVRAELEAEMAAVRDLLMRSFLGRDDSSNPPPRGAPAETRGLKLLS